MGLHNLSLDLTAIVSQLVSCFLSLILLLSFSSLQIWSHHFPQSILLWPPPPPAPPSKEPKLFKAWFKRPLVIWPHPSFQIHHCHSTPTTVNSAFPFFHTCFIALENLSPPFPHVLLSHMIQCSLQRSSLWPLLQLPVSQYITALIRMNCNYSSSLHCKLLQVKDYCLTHLCITRP